MDAWSIRPARPDDAPRIAAAERECFSDPWSEAAILEALHNETVLALVGEHEGRLAGYLLARTIAGDAEILNLAVLPVLRRRGLGRRLLEAGLAGLAAAGARSVFLEVRQSNEVAKQLYLMAGFRPVGVRPGYYRRPTEGAFVLRRELGGSA
jgi:ribosomal-protein-alanine N-acetyltransferase